MSLQQLKEPILGLVARVGRYGINSSQKWTSNVRCATRIAPRQYFNSRRFCHSIAVPQPDKTEVVLNSNDGPRLSQAEARVFSLGKCVVERVLVEKLLTEFPRLEVADIIGVVDSIIYLKSRELNNEEATREFLTQLGSLYRDKVSMDNFHLSIDDAFSSHVNGNKLPRLVKLAHPKFILMEIATKSGENMHIKTSIIKKRTHGVAVGLYVNDNLVGEATGDNFTSAERDVCRDYLLSQYKGEFENMELPDKEGLCLEEEIHIRDSPQQRKVELVKEENDHYGFYIRGGEQEELSTVKHRQFFYYTPPFISKIDVGSPAHKSGKLQVGDVILAIGDFTTKGMSHQRLVKLIQGRKTTLQLTVILNPDVKMRDFLRQKEKERGLKKMKADVSAEKWREWHLAHAEKNPLKYLKLIKELESNKNQS